MNYGRRHTSGKAFQKVWLLYNGLIACFLELKWTKFKYGTGDWCKRVYGKYILGIPKLSLKFSCSPLCPPCNKIFDTTIMNPESILVRLLTQKHVKNELSMKSMIHFMHEFYSAQFLQDPFHPQSNFQVFFFNFILCNFLVQML